MDKTDPDGRRLVPLTQSRRWVIVPPAAWSAKGIVQIIILVGAAALIAAAVATFSIARDYGYLHASILTGTTGGQYHALATRLAERAEREHGLLAVVPTAGSVENVRRLAASDADCADMFAFVQDGIPIPTDAKLELLGRLPEPETLLFFGRSDRTLRTFNDMRGSTIGIGPEGSGTAYLMQQLFQDPDLRGLGAHLAYHDLEEQAGLVARGKLDFAATVMQENAPFVRGLVHQYNLDIVSPRDLEGLVERFPWLTLGNIPVGRFDLARPVPSAEKQVARLATLVVANQCAKRADPVALLTFLGAELPGFVRGNPPNALAPTTLVPLAAEARQFFLTGEPELADRYFPWLVNLMSPAYWVYLVMAVTIIFNGMKTYSRFRLWRIDAAREKLEAALGRLAGPGLTPREIHAGSADKAALAETSRSEAEGVLRGLDALHARCQRQVKSFVTPMGDEMYYRYQQALIDEARRTISALLRRSDDRRGRGDGGLQ